jgi:formate hydrogenlyase subunit 3/multisubunit Na+/H+ antiporter MnhD subunit
MFAAVVVVVVVVLVLVLVFSDVAADDVVVVVAAATAAVAVVVVVRTGRAISDTSSRLSIMSTKSNAGDTTTAPASGDRSPIA